MKFIHVNALSEEICRRTSRKRLRQYLNRILCNLRYLRNTLGHGGNALWSKLCSGCSLYLLERGDYRGLDSSRITAKAIAMRLLLSMFEAGLFHVLTFVISTMYWRKKQAKRLAVLYGVSALSGAFGGLIAYQ